MSEAMARLQADLSRELDRIAKRFRNGAKLTLVVRNPIVGEDAGLVIGNDDFEEAIKEIRTRMATDPFAQAQRS